MKERILTIRLIEKAERIPSTAASLGIVIVNSPGFPVQQYDAFKQKHTMAI